MKILRRLGLGLATAAIALAGLAGQSDAAPADNPSQSCGVDDIYVRVTQWRGQTIVRLLPIATHGGCASSWATGQMSVAAVAGQCKRLEAGVIGPDGNPFQLTYPHTFYGIWTAENRAGCIDVLHGLATGRLDADVLPFPF